MLWLVQVAFSQSLNYVQYDIDNGLAGSTVYRICQDRDGFIWFSTETGVSRFDGRQFTNYTVQEGLPDNDILFMYCDSRNRIWFGPFKNDIAYYYKGKIYNQQNDSMLKGADLKGFIRNILEDKNGNLFFHDYPHVHALLQGKHQRVKSFLDTTRFQACLNIGKNSEGRLLLDVYKRNTPMAALYEWTPSRLQKIGKLSTYAPGKTNYQLLSDKFRIEWIPGSDHQVSIYSYTKHQKKSIKAPTNLSSYSVISEDSLFMNTRDGAFCYRFSTNTLSEPFLKGKKIGQVFKDDENSLWFSTLGEGVFRLSASETRNYTFNKIYGDETSVYAFEKDNHQLHVGIEMEYITTFDEQKKLFSHTRFQPYKDNPFSIEHKISFIKKINAEEIIYGTNYGTFKLNTKNRSVIHIYNTAKAMAIKNSREILVGEYHRLLLLDASTLNIKKKLLDKRVTALYHSNDSTFVGTLEGMYLLTHDTCVRFLGPLHPALQRRISAIVPSADGSLWISTYDSGVLRWNKGKSFTTFTMRRGLVSNICRTLFIDKNDVWIGTDKGLNRIRFSKQSFHIDLYNTTDGLISNIVNAILAADSMVYIGTPKGLTFLKPHTLTQFSKCRLAFLGTYINNQPIPAQQEYRFSYPNNKNIRFEFTAIAFKAGRQVIYHYLLSGFDKQWQQTRQNQIEYLSLPAGNYQLTVVAVNQAGQRSLPLKINFEIIPPYWETIWFYLLITVLLGSGLTWFIRWRLKQIQQQAQEKQQLHQKITELEQRALKSQMNPHFIFNCLNSIQKYILEKDTLQANKYLHLFSKLVRQTLDISSQVSIAVEEEVNYLTNYLDLEKMRFGDKFDFKIQLEPQASRLRIPGMILQPFVENSIRHGIRYKENGTGMITIGIKTDATHLRCIIEDNGVGRQQAQRLKSLQHIEYQSRGMNLTAERIQAINRSHVDRSAQITIEVVDLEDELKMPCGTRVCIGFPLTILQSFA